MRKNSQIHLLIETEFLERLKKQAIEQEITISELCRRKLKESPQLSRIEIIVEEINRKIAHLK